MEYLTVNNKQYAVTVHQKKDFLPYLLMLHGFMGDQRIFNPLISGLNTVFNPITIDLLGFGETDKPKRPQRYKDQYQTDDLLQLISKLNVPSLFLYGYSMGGRLALQLAVKNADRFEGIILESTNCGISDPTERKKRQQKDAKRARSIRNNFEIFLSRWKTLRLFKSPLPVDEKRIQQYQQIQSEQCPSALAASLIGFGTGSMMPVCDQLDHISQPALLIAGSADKKYQRINQDLAEQLPNATFASIQAGHRVHLDNPSVLIDRIQDFLKNI